MTPSTAYLCLGSNLGERFSNLQQAIDKLQLYVNVNKVSPVFETEPVEMETSGRFYNVGVKIETELKFTELLKLIKNIEHELGREPDSHLKPRTIDIDILMYENFVYQDEQLHIPHPKLTKRKFALTVLHEIAPEIYHPVSKKTIRELLKNCQDTSAVVKTNLKLNIKNK